MIRTYSTSIEKLDFDGFLNVKRNIKDNKCIKKLPVRKQMFLRFLIEFFIFYSNAYGDQ